MMRAGMILALGLGLTACATPKGEVPPVETPAPPPAPTPAPQTPMPDDVDLAEITDEEVSVEQMYGEDYALNNFWAGEWPNGFTVTADDVVVMGRAHYHTFFEADIACPLPKNMNVNPWNTARIETDDWEFMTASPRTKITITEDVTLDTGYAEEPKVLELKAGDILIYETYYAEGFFQASFNGEYYELNEADLNQKAEFEQGGVAYEWVNVACGYGKGTRAWLLLSEIEGQDGIGMASFDAFGVASDLDKGPNTITR